MKKITKVNKYSTCLSYVLDRVEKEDSFAFIKDIPSTCFIPFNSNNVEVGDIVAWKNSTPLRYFHSAITTVDGKPAILPQIEDCSYHLGVVEVVNRRKNIIISDCVRNLNTNSFPEIRLRLADLINPDNGECKIPNYIIKL